MIKFATVGAGWIVDMFLDAAKDVGSGIRTCSGIFFPAGGRRSVCEETRRRQSLYRFR